jgi:alpha-glucosidase
MIDIVAVGFEFGEWLSGKEGAATMSSIIFRRFALVVCMLATGLVAQTPAVPASAAAASDSTWWKHAVIYEIYPRSFQDSNGDGIGDLNGITQRLDYLQALGVDAIWISPMYPSPQVDFGYDISDYENVDPQYGTLKDFDRLVAEAKKRNIRVILDMVLNHTSDKHKWFIESASSRTNAKRDWYMWSNGKDGGKPGPNGKPVPPNNWESLFGGSAWEYMPQTKSFYYHKFYKQQPDLNWSNPAVEKAMFGSMQFWLDRGVAGYRLDAIPTLFEDPQLRDEPVLGGTNAQGDPNLEHIYTDNLPAVHGVIRRMRAMVAKYPASNYPGDRVLIGETYLPNTAELDKWYGGTKKDELQLPMDMIVGFSNKLDANVFRARISEVETQVHGSQPLLVFDNHDNIRSWERYGDGVHNVAIAKLIATMLFTTRATALMYYGEELGMTTTTPARVEDVKDPIGRTGWPKEKGRDGERTPMQWDSSVPQAGFSTSATTWLPVASNYKTVNVQTELTDPNSLLNWHKQLIEMRRKRDAVRDGGMVMLDTSNPNVLSYVRTAPPGHHNIVVALNMTGQPQKIALDLKEAGIQQTAMKTLMTNEPSLMGATTTLLTLPPFASWIGEVQMP